MLQVCVFVFSFGGGSVVHCGRCVLLCFISLFFKQSSKFLGKKRRALGAVLGSKLAF